MPALTSIALADREATPVTHTFTPLSLNGGVAKFVNNASGVPIGFETLSASLRLVGNRYKYKQVLYLPVVQTETINGISLPKVIRANFGSMEYVFDASSTLQERKNLQGMMEKSQAAALTFINDMVVNLNAPY